MKLFLFAVLGLFLVVVGGYGGGYRKTPCPVTQPGLIVRDLDHPPSSRPVDREWVVTVAGGILQPGLNQSQAEALAVQLNRMFPDLHFTAHPQMSLKPASYEIEQEGPPGPRGPRGYRGYRGLPGPLPASVAASTLPQNALGIVLPDGTVIPLSIINPTSSTTVAQARMGIITSPLATVANNLLIVPVFSTSFQVAGKPYLQANIPGWQPSEVTSSAAQARIGTITSPLRGNGGGLLIVPTNSTSSELPGKTYGQANIAAWIPCPPQCQ